MHGVSEACETSGLNNRPDCFSCARQVNLFHMIRWSNRTLFAWLGFIILMALLQSLYLIQPRLTWPDAPGFTSALESGRWVAHPPGYPLFFALAHLLMALGFQAVYAQQTLSVGAYLLSIPILFVLLRRHVHPFRALALTGVFAFSWIPLNLAAAGTTHSSDLLMASLFLWIITSPGFQKGRSAWLAFFYVCMLACGANRLSTLVMFAPVWALLFWENRAKPAWWAGAFLYGMGQLGVFALTAHLYGGWNSFQAEVSHLSGVNKATSPLLSGLHSTTILNLFRPFLWFLLALLPLPLLWRLPRLKNIGAISFNDPFSRGILLSLLAILGTFLICTLYICVHPGYLAPALPAAFLLTALILEKQVPPAKTESVFIGFALVFSLGMFHLMSPFQQPKNLAQAAANALVLQYSRQGLETPGWKSLSRWLMDAGLKQLVPESRQDAPR